MEIITGYTGKPHVTSEQDRDVNIGVVGKGSYVLQTGMQLAAEVSSNNEIKIRDGVLMHQGCTASIKKNTYDSLIIINGSQGMKRIDLIVARYEKNQDNGIESLDLKVIQGTPAESTPTVPEYTEGDIQAGDYVADMPMYQVIIDGLNITEVKKVFEVAPSIDALKKEIAELNSNKKVECFSKTVATDVDLLVDFSAEVNSIIKNGGKIVSAIPGTTTNSNNALVYGKVAIQALPDWSEVYVRCNSNYYSGLGGTTTLNLLVIYV
ncbi:hypothetical protein [Dorea formicigenerans]|uniref:Uncharacterized protein n=1 Tax=Dorea formicigenerans TaxID=39486 RepID=A0A412EZF2_9FIRM|nr:hypothetical protein [Dorea formicigenerans]RGR58374.1 hypothetical protein DWY33_09635 [Dorea formicigenerans]